MKRSVLILLALVLATIAGGWLAAVPAPPAVAQPGAAPAISLGFQEIGRWSIVHRAADGRVLWSEIAHNALANVGQQRMLEITFRGGSALAALYMALADATNPCSVTKTDSTATALTGEPSGNGYARVQIEQNSTGWPTSALDSGDWQLTSKVLTFTASGAGWGPVNCAVLTTAVSGTAGDHLMWAALSQARTLAAGESLDVTLKVKQQ